MLHPLSILHTLNLFAHARFSLTLLPLTLHGQHTLLLPAPLATPWPPPSFGLHPVVPCTPPYTFLT